jgi:phosphoribosylformylglycinamidine synthase
MLWEVSIHGLPTSSAAEFGSLRTELDSFAEHIEKRLGKRVPEFSAHRGYLIEGDFDRPTVERIANILLADPVIEFAEVTPAVDVTLSSSTITVLRKPGVMDPVASTAQSAIAQLGCRANGVKTYRRFIFPSDADRVLLELVAVKVLANSAIDQIVFGPLRQEHLARGSKYELVKITVPIRDLDDDGLARLNRDGQLFLNIAEMRAIRDHFIWLGRNPTDVELETIAQTWSEHCSHKTLRGPFVFNNETNKAGLLKDTIMHATRALDRDWCLSVFVDNAGVVRFDDDWAVCFKVETHNHPSAIEPYGGANTGIGGVIRDALGTGLGAKPVANTDVFCVGDPNTAHDVLPDGVLHPARVLRGVVAGVRDYGNRMGIPTVNGAVCFDQRYLANPLVFCGTIGVLPLDKVKKEPKPGDLIVAIGGRTGRDGIHGATFSSGELTCESETASGGAVQIGNAITEKKLLDVILRARDMGLYHAITDCGAGGFSSAVGEMGAGIGARVTLESAPLKYEGLSYTEIWISEAQERMVLAVPPENWEPLRRLAASEDVEAVVLGRFEPTGRLVLTYHGQVVGDLEMRFLHEGRPPLVREALAANATPQPHCMPRKAELAPGLILKRILGSPNVCSKEWIIRQYDHEVQGGSVIKPLVGADDDGPSDAAVLTPILGSTRGIAIGCGINPRFGDLDPYRMAASAIDEAIRNVVAVGGDPTRTALLDNFCWGNTERPDVFGSLCRAAFACRDVAIGYGTPFISGKDSLNNEFNSGTTRIVIPPTLLISALAIVPDVRRCVTMDLKEVGNRLILVGTTNDELGGSHFNLVTGSTGGVAPGVNTDLGKRIVAAVHHAISSGLVRSCHDLSEGGSAAALAEMALAGGTGATLELARVPMEVDLPDCTILFAESNTRFLLEVTPGALTHVLDLFDGLPANVVGQVTAEPILTITRNGSTLLAEPIAELKDAWKKQPFAW